MPSVIGGDKDFRQRLSKEIEALNYSGATTIVLDYVYPRDIKKILGPKLLVRFEGPSTSARSHTRRYEMLFDEVIDVGTSAEFPWPMEPRRYVEDSSNSVRKNSAVMVLGNKFSLSSSQLYSCRRALEALNHPHLSVFGTGWDLSLRKRIVILSRELLIQLQAGGLNPSPIKGWLAHKIRRGAKAPDKYACYRNFAIAVVIENDTQKITEKIFDALISGCFVFYVGANTSYLTPAILERVEQLPSEPKLIIDKINEMRFNEYVAPSKTHVSELERLMYTSWGTLAASIVDRAEMTSKAYFKSNR